MRVRSLKHKEGTCRKQHNKESFSIPPLPACIENPWMYSLRAVYLLDTTVRGRRVIRVWRVFAWVSSASVPRINNRGGRWHGSALPGAAQPEPEGDRSSIVLPCNSRQNHLSATLLHSPALITNWSVIHHPQCRWGLLVVGVCVPYASTRKKGGGGWGGRCHLWIPVLSLFLISTLYFFSSAECEERGGGEIGAKQTQQTVGDLI